MSRAISPSYATSLDKANGPKRSRGQCRELPEQQRWMLAQTASQAGRFGDAPRVTSSTPWGFVRKLRGADDVSRTDRDGRHTDVTMQQVGWYLRVDPSHCSIGSAPLTGCARSSASVSPAVPGGPRPNMSIAQSFLQSVCRDSS